MPEMGQYFFNFFDYFCGTLDLRLQASCLTPWPVASFVILCHRLMDVRWQRYSYNSRESQLPDDSPAPVDRL